MSNEERNAAIFLYHQLRESAASNGVFMIFFIFAMTIGIIFFIDYKVGKIKNK